MIVQVKNFWLFRTGIACCNWLHGKLGGAQYATLLFIILISSLFMLLQSDCEIRIATFLAQMTRHF